MSWRISHPYTRRGWTAVLVILSTRLAALAMWSVLPPLPAHLTFALIAGDLILLGWQVWYGVKIIKSINGFPLTWALWAVVLMVIAATLSNALDRAATLYARAPEAAIGPAILQLDNSAAIFMGEIDFAAFNALQETLRTNPDVTALHLTSNGGRIAAARGMARLVLEHKLNTQAIGTCASACVLVFMAGSERRLAPDAQLGFHGYGLISSIVTLNTSDEETRDKQALALRGVDQTFLEKAFDTPHDQMWFPSPDELRAAGVTTAP